MFRKDKVRQERREYVRLESVFPVQFQLLSLDGKQVLSNWQQGFTNNIGKGGICLSVNNLNPDLAQLIKSKQAKLSLVMEMPIIRKPLSAQAKVVWIKDVPSQPNKYLIGLAYEQIDPRQNSRIIRYVITKKYLPPVVSAIVVILILFTVINGYLTRKLIRDNKALVEQLVAIIQEHSLAKQDIKEINREREDLQLRIQTLQSRIQTIEEEKANKEETKIGEIKKLNSLIDQLTKEKASLQDELIVLQRKESVVTEELLRLDKKKATLEKVNLDKMYKWLVAHQNPRTGLVMSFKGDKDIANWVFTYDQAFAIQIATHFSDFPRARKILDFFSNKAKRIDGRFLNTYYIKDGSPAGFVVHSGPNIWLGIAILQYTKKSKDNSYLKLAEEIASATIYLQNLDDNGGIREGPDVSEYSTKSNLNARIFFDILYKITGKLQYQEARDKVLKWLLSQADAK